MYLKHFNLTAKPFETTADPEFLWFGEKHKEAYALLRYGVHENKGLLLLTGDIGVGKTTLIAAVVEEFSEGVLQTIIADPGVAVMDFYRYLAHGFGLDTSFASKAEFLTRFREFLHESHERGMQVLLIIDEAQRMGQRLLEDVRLLSNIEKDGIKLINVFFVGQAEFLETLQGRKLRSLRQRITLSYAIEPLDLNETGRYVAARLRKAGAQANCFTKAAIEEIYSYSGGSPRMINILCDLAMVVGYSKGVTRLEKQTVRDAAQRLPGIVLRPKKARNSEPEMLREGPVISCALREKEPSSVAHHRGTLFLVGGLALTLFFAVGLTWLRVSGKGGLLSYSGPVQEKSVEVNLPAGGQVARLIYPVTLLFLNESGRLAPRSVPLVQAIASSLAKDGDSLVVVRGVAMGKADSTVNLTTSRGKAEWVKVQLMAAGISGERIRVFGLGDAKERADVFDVHGTKANIYVEIDVVR